MYDLPSHILLSCCFMSGVCTMSYEKVTVGVNHTHHNHNHNHNKTAEMWM